MEVCEKPASYNDLSASASAGRTVVRVDVLFSADRMSTSSPASRSSRAASTVSTMPLLLLAAAIAKIEREPSSRAAIALLTCAASRNKNAQLQENDVFVPRLNLEWGRRSNCQAATDQSTRILNEKK